METSVINKTAEVGIKLNFEDAIKDSPLFRAALQRNEDELDELALILDSLVKISRTCLEHAAKLAEALGKLGPNIKKLAGITIFDVDKTPTCLTTIIEFVESTFILHERLIRDLGQRLLIPMIQSVQDDLREIRDQRKQQERAREKYETLTNKYGSIPKLKEYALIREDTFQLYDGRKQYYQQLFNYITRINKFKKGVDMFFVDKCLGTIESLRDFTEVFGMMVEALKEPAQSMRTSWLGWQREVKLMISKMELQARDSLAWISAKHSPDAPYDASVGVCKQGHLYRKRQKGIGLGWKRVWLTLTEDYLVTECIQGRHRGVVEKNFELHVLLCEIKPWDGDRRHCFEITTSRRLLVYQAETEEEMRDWLRVFEGAKTHALQHGDIGEDVKEDEIVDESIDDQTAIMSSSSTAQKRNSLNVIVDEQMLVPFPPSETLMTTLACLWTFNEIASFGKLYATEKAIYLCSVLFGVKTVTSYQLKDLPQCTFTTIEVTGVLVLDEDLSIKTISDDMDSIDIVKTVWKNAHSEKPKSATELKTCFGPSSDWTIVHGPSIKCQCKSHLERIEYDAIIPMPLEGLIELMFSPNSPVYSALFVKRRYKNIEKLPLWKYSDNDSNREVNNDTIGSANNTGDEAKTETEVETETETKLNNAARSFEYIIPVNHPLVKVKETECYETQTMKRDQGWYSVLEEAKTPAVIYGDAFVTQCLICLTKVSGTNTGGEEKTRIKICLGVKFLKNPLVKSMIRSSTLKGLAEYVTDLVDCLWSELKKTNPEAKEEKVEISADEGDQKMEKLKEESWLALFDGAIKYGTEKINAKKEPILKSIISAVVLWLLFCFIARFTDRLYWKSHSATSNDTINKAPLNATFSLSDHASLYKSIANKRQTYHNSAEKLSALQNQLGKEDCKLAYTQYLIWMADQLATCYADTKKSMYDCKKIEKTWADASKISITAICK